MVNLSGFQDANYWWYKSEDENSYFWDFKRFRNIFCFIDFFCGGVYLLHIILFLFHSIHILQYVHFLYTIQTGKDKQATIVAHVTLRGTDEPATE